MAVPLRVCELCQHVPFVPQDDYDKYCTHCDTAVKRCQRALDGEEVIVFGQWYAFYWEGLQRLRPELNISFEPLENDTNFPRQGRLIVKLSGKDIKSANKS